MRFPKKVYLYKVSLLTSRNCCPFFTINNGTKLSFGINFWNISRDPLCFYLEVRSYIKGKNITYSGTFGHYIYIISRLLPNITFLFLRKLLTFLVQEAQYYVCEAGKLNSRGLYYMKFGSKKYSHSFCR